MRPFFNVLKHERSNLKKELKNG